MNETSLERFEAEIAAMPDVSENGGDSEVLATPKSDLEKASEVFGMVEKLDGDSDAHMADLVRSANEFAAAHPGSDEASAGATIADAAGALNILEGGDIGDTAQTLGEQPLPPLEAALSEISAADPSGEAIYKITEAIDEAEAKLASPTLQKLREQIGSGTIDIRRVLTLEELDDIGGDLIRTIRREDLLNSVTEHKERTGVDNPNSHSRGLFFGEGPTDGVAMSEQNAYRSVDVRAIVDLIDSGVVRGAYTASGGEHAQTEGHTTHWSDGVEGIRHSFKAEGAFVIEASRDALDQGWVTADKLVGVWTRDQSGNTRNLLAQ